MRLLLNSYRCDDQEKTPIEKEEPEKGTKGAEGVDGDDGANVPDPQNPPIK